MREKFRNLSEVYKYYSDEAKCREYLAFSRWGDKPICPYCNHDKVYNIENGKRYKCANKECYKKFSVTVGTIFEDSNLPLTIWFPAIYLITSHKKGISSLQLSRDLGITQKSAWFVNHRIREMLREKNPVMLSNKVEIDETYLGGKEGNRHANKKVKTRYKDTSTVERRKLKDAGKLNTIRWVKIAVLGLVERDGKVVAKRVYNTYHATLMPEIEKHVAKGATMLTDEFYGYDGLHLRGYTHKTIQHRLKIYVQGDVHTNTIENFWSVLKRGLYGVYHYTSEKHINRYLDEFCARYNTRTLGEGERFDLYLPQCSDRRLKYADLIS